MTSTSDFSACPASEAILTTNKMTMRENISRSTEISFNMISTKMVIPLLFLVIFGCDGVSRDMEHFLREHGLGNLTQTFVSEEIEVRDVNKLTDQNLMDLGVRTMGARLRLRSAATAWVSPQVTCLFLHKNCLVKSFCVS